MSFTQSQKSEIENMIKKEIKTFFNSNTLTQFENKMIDLVKNEIKTGKIRVHITEFISKAFSEFYYTLYLQRSSWEPKIKKIKIN